VEELLRAASAAEPKWVVDPEFEDMLRVLSESAWPAYRALYAKLLEGFCQRATAAVCSVKAK